MTHGVDGDVLLLDLPATPAFLPVLRTATAGLATRLSFDLDAIEDLRLAVDETAGLMMAAVNTHDASSTLHCRFDVTETELLISIGAAGIGTLPPRQSFDWRVLDALTGSVSTELHDGVTTVRLAQPRPRVSERPLGLMTIGLFYKLNRVLKRERSAKVCFALLSNAS